MTAIALLTDFGTQDIYTGVMKGVIHGLAPNAQHIDLTHEIEPQNVRQAAFALMNAHRYFPEDTVFLVVVDPGVGSTRRPVAVKSGGRYYVAPDNGVLTYALRDADDVQAVEIKISEDRAHEVSNTFHGRDIFAPTAARLATGTPLADIGTPLDKLFTLPEPHLMVTGSQNVEGEIVHIDRFGNLVTSIGHIRWLDTERAVLAPAFSVGTDRVQIDAGKARVDIGGEQIVSIKHSYHEAERGGLLALIGSTAYLEICANQASAAARLDVVIGDRIRLQVK